MLVEYVGAALKKTVYKKLEDDTWFAEIPGFQGVWANGKTIEDCRTDLVDVLEEWIVLKLRDREAVPVVDGADIRIRETTAV